MVTSSFSKARYLFDLYKPEFQFVSVANSTPMYARGLMDFTCYSVIPPWPMVQAFKSNNDEPRFISAYRRTVLDKLDPDKFVDEVGVNSVLFCWCGTGKFCHRHIIAQWLKDTISLDVKEF